MASMITDNHNHYNFLKCDWCTNCFISDSVIGHLAVIGHL